MNPPKSLSQFFDQVDHATLNNCDTEQIHLSGMIQNVGALIAVEPETTKVLAASANIADYLGMASDALIDRPLVEIDADLAEEIADVRGEPQLLHEVLDFNLELAAGSFDT